MCLYRVLSYSPEFTQAITAVRDDVEVGVMQESSEYVGFFPYHRIGGIGKPIGMRLSDVQAVIVGKDVQWDALSLVQACGLKSWEFNNLISSQAQLQPYQWGIGVSPYIDLSQGFDFYEQQRRASGSKIMRQVARKRRKLELDVGRIRFEIRSFDRDAFQTMLRWKSDQRAATKTFNALSFDWVVELLRRVSLTNGATFSGLLSTLHAGKRLVAVHLGMCSDRVLHAWFPTFNQVYGEFSPGIMLLVETARAAAAAGIQRIDLGRGRDRFKQRLMSGCMSVAEGSVDSRASRRIVSEAMYHVRRQVRLSPLEPVAQTPKRLLRTWLESRLMS